MAKIAVSCGIVKNIHIKYPLGMGGEDFSAFSRVILGTYAFVGTGNPDKATDYAHHHPKFALDEDSFIDGVKMMVYVALEMGK